MSLYQVGEDDTRKNMELGLFAQILKEPCFNVLRTQEQLGYIGKVRYQLDITKNHPLGGAQKLLISLFDTIFGQFLVVFGPL